MRTQTTTVEKRIASIASRQFGIVEVEQMRAADIGRSAIKRRSAKGLLIPEYRGVYRVGQPAIR
jgi:hypothetical protein